MRTNWGGLLNESQRISKNVLLKCVGLNSKNFEALQSKFTGRYSLHPSSKKQKNKSPKQFLRFFDHLLHHLLEIAIHQRAGSIRMAAAAVAIGETIDHDFSL